MEITYDPAKNERNIRERGLSFERAIDFDFETARRVEDTRRDYGERRFLAVGYLDERLLCCASRQPMRGSGLSASAERMRER